MTWKKEGIASHWTGVRGYRKKCCKVCCEDITCNGCGTCNGCHNSPIRGNYDGLVVLTAITREALPTYVPTNSLQVRRQQEKLLDQGHFAVTLESALTSHFMYGGDEYQRCVPTNTMAIGAGDSVDDGRSHKKRETSYVVYVAYRLQPGQAFNHNAKISRQLIGGNTNGNATIGGIAAAPEEDNDGGGRANSRPSSGSLQGPLGAYDIEDIDEYEYGKAGDDPGDETGADEYDEKVLEELDEKQLQERIGALELDHSSVKEQVWKLEHGRQWMENRLTALESKFKTENAS